MFLCFSCANNDRARKSVGTHEIPCWVSQGPHCIQPSQKKFIYGIGRTMIQHSSLYQADKNARKDLNITLKYWIGDIIHWNYVNGCIKMHPSNIILETPLPAKRILELIILLPAEEYSYIIDRYYDFKERVQYSLARFDVNNFKEVLKRAKNEELGHVYYRSITCLQKIVDEMFEDIEKK